MSVSREMLFFLVSLGLVGLLLVMNIWLFRTMILCGLIVFVLGGLTFV